MFSRLREPGPSRLASKRAINAYRRRSDAVYLVSFPRTGSHWLRMMCEQYAQRPTLVRAFYPHDNTDYLFMHIHDVDLDFSASNVIYLYRDPVETVYSMLKYAQASGDDQVRLWSDRYASHLRKWLLQEDFTPEKLAKTAVELLQPERQAQLQSDLAYMKHRLGEPGAVNRVAQLILKITEERK